MKQSNTLHKFRISGPIRIGLTALLLAVALLPGRAGAQSIHLTSLFHDQGPLFDSAAEPDVTTPVTVRLQCAKDDLTAANVKYYDEADQSMHLLPMFIVGHDPTGLYDYWEATIPASPSHKYYYFQAIDGDAMAWYNANGASSTESTTNSFYIVPGFTTPDWMKNGVMYQIFPDRFYNGDPKNDTKTDAYGHGPVKPLHKKWGESPIGDAGHYNSMVFFGGDLAGIQHKLSYVTETLGADILYLNPIFKSPTNHKYDTSDYMTVDPCFGGKEALHNLVTAVHSRHGYVILDGVFNHTSDSHFWFSGSKGAIKAKTNPYYSYYTFFNWPGSYSHFPDATSMPKLDYGREHSAVRKAIYESPKSIAQTYLRPPYSVDGWRLDASWMVDANGNGGAGDIDHQIWREFRKAVKGVNPNALIFGENWGDASSWLYYGDQFDGATNFIGFTDPLSDWINGVDHNGDAHPLSVSQFDAVLRQTRAVLPTNVQEVMDNHLGNHDTSRFAQRADGDIGKIDLALIFQMTYVGTPTIYYGDEYGMMGGNDPDCRRTFDWSKATPTNGTVALTKKLIGMRKRFSALRTGSLMTLLTDNENKIYSFARLDLNNRIVVVLNDDTTDHKPTVSIDMAGITNGSFLTDALTGTRYTVTNGTVTPDIKGLYGAILIAGPSKS